VQKTLPFLTSKIDWSIFPANDIAAIGAMSILKIKE